MKVNRKFNNAEDSEATYERIKEYKSRKHKDGYQFKNWELIVAYNEQRVALGMNPLTQEETEQWLADLDFISTPGMIKKMISGTSTSGTRTEECLTTTSEPFI